MTCQRNARLLRYTTALCVAPPLDLEGAHTSSVEVTLALNGAHFLSALPPITYTYYTQEVVSVEPTGGRTSTARTPSDLPPTPESPACARTRPARPTGHPHLPHLSDT